MANLLAHELNKDFGLYHVLGVLGDGSMGRLYLAERRGERRNPKGAAAVFALKSFALDGSRAELLHGAQLQGAARWIATLAHPNIVATSELGELDGRTFLAMEYLPGENLAAILASATSAPGDTSSPAAKTMTGPMPPDVAAALIQQSLAGLSHAHEFRLPPGESQSLAIRPDLRPSNIFVTYQGVAKVLGCAESILFGSGADLRAGARGGLAYTAPELLDPRAVQGVDDARAAVFSAGVILWECLTGRQLFAAESADKTMDAIRSRYIEPPSVFRPAAPPGLDEVVLRATSRDPRRRYQSAREMSQALDKALLNPRPSPETIAAWLEGRFGVERAALKNQIARGIAVEAAVVRLRLLGDGSFPVHLAPAAPGADAGLSPMPIGASAAVPSRTPAATPPTSGRDLRKIYALCAAIAVVGIGAVMFSSERAGPSKSPLSPVAPVGALQIQSNPAGAQILIDGDPSGLVTPARIDGLRAGRKVEVRVDKPGYRAAAQVANIPLGGPQVLSFALEESLGRVRFEGVPSVSTAYVDDAPVDVKHPLSLPVGAHRLRVEVAGRLVGSMKFEVQAGEHTVHVNALEGSDK